MIIKLAERKTKDGKSFGSFGALAKYLMNAPEENERVLDSWSTNCAGESIDDAVFDIKNTQSLNNKIRKSPNYHLICSFATGEKVSVEQMKEMEEKIVKALGFEDHQRISVVHGDTDNLHWHIAINRIHPVTLKSHEPWRGKMIMQEISAKLEEEYNLVRVNHFSTRTVGQSKANDMEAHRCQESMMTYAKGISPQLKAAKNWQELHSVLFKNGLYIHEKGQGFVVGNGKVLKDKFIFIKASSIDRELSKKYLTERLGEYEPKTERKNEKKPEQSYEAKPIEPPPAIAKLISRIDRIAERAKDKPKQTVEKEKKEPSVWDLPSHEFLKVFSWNDKNNVFDRDKTEELFWQKADQEYRRILASEYVSREKRYELKQAWLISKKTKKESWKDHCHRLAKGGSKEHLVILREMEQHQKLKQNILSGHRAIELPWQWSYITKGGVVKYQSKHGIVRDEGKIVNIDKVNMQSVALIVDVAIYKFALGKGKTVKLGDNSDDKFKEMVVAYAKANKLESKIRNFEELNTKYGNDSIVKTYKEKVINTIKDKLGLPPNQFRDVIPESRLPEYVRKNTRSKQQDQEQSR